MSTLLDALSSEPKARRTRPCELNEWINRLTPEEAQSIRSAIAGSQWTNVDLANIISANGHSVSYSTIANHRRNTCATCRS